jgi:hypothetical protein
MASTVEDQGRGSGVIRSVRDQRARPGRASSIEDQGAGTTSGVEDKDSSGEFSCGNGSPNPPPFGENLPVPVPASWKVFSPNLNSMENGDPTWTPVPDIS